MVEVTCPTPKSQVADLGVLLSHCEGWLRPPAMQIGLGDTLLFDLEQRTQDEKVFVGGCSSLVLVCWSLCWPSTGKGLQPRGCQHVMADGVHL